MFPYLSMSCATLLSLCTLCAYLHKRRRCYIKSLIENISDRNDKTEAIWEAFDILTNNEFVFEMELSLQARGLLTTYGIPTISSVLKMTAGFEKEVHRRYADMTLLISEFLENDIGEISKNSDLSHFKRGQVAIQRLNAIHRKYGKYILEDDMFYVLAVFMTVPGEFCETRWSHRSMTKEEKHILFLYWIEIGCQMNLNMDSKQWSNYYDCLTFRRDYEKKFMRYTEANKDITMATLSYFINTFPSILKPSIQWFVLHSLSYLQESNLHREALGFPMKSSIFITIFIDILLTSSAIFRQYFLPPYHTQWNRRITGKNPITSTTTVGMDTNNMKDNESHSVAPCPFHAYYLSRPLDHGNMTYSTATSTTSKPYVIEYLGPAGIKKGELCEKPVYATREKSE